MNKFVPVLLLITVSSLAGEVVRRGGAIAPDVRRVELVDVVRNASAYTNEPVVVEGVVAKNCEKKGCWMQLAPAGAGDGIRVTFKDYKFFVPLDSQGSKVLAQGVTVVKTHSKRDADHLENEGARLTRNADGTATEVSFVASAVELRK